MVERVNYLDDNKKNVNEFLVFCSCAQRLRKKI